ncbi:MAG TPA: hypothetical protein PKA82_01880 [Pyrinomonadaceae bacterium]|nr:hypothetical protein [Pyrinomonadaceae bacterium]
MSILEKDATAFVKVRGLGIAAFNETKKVFENAILRHGKHKLRVTVKGPKIVGGKPSRNDEVLFDLPITDLLNVKIKVSTTGTPETSGIKRYTPGWFSRLVGLNDPNDLRWVLNFGSELHGNKLVKNTTTTPGQKPAVSRLEIANAWFFSEIPEPRDLKKGPYFLKKDDQTGTREPFGFMAESIVGRMKATSVVLDIDTPKKKHHKEFVHVDMRPYTIEITNVDSSTTSTPNEIKILYKFLKNPAGKQYDLEGWVPFTPKGSSSTGMDYCHITDGDGGGIDEFLP